MVNEEGAEYDLSDSSRSSVLAERGHATVRAPDTDSAIDVTRDHAGAVRAEGDLSDRRMVNTLLQNQQSVSFSKLLLKGRS